MNSNFLYNDIELLLNIQQNDERALACLMRKYYSVLYRFALQFTRDEELIKKCIHDVFVGLWQQRCFEDRIFSIQAYLLRDTRDKLSQRMRQEDDIVFPKMSIYMHTKSITRFGFLSMLLFISCLLMGQPPRGPLIISPQVNADKTVTFRYLAPYAKEVKLSAQFEKAPVAMSKDTAGIWSATVGPVRPDIYPYSFNVDGITVMDPANTLYFPNERFKASLADIPADTPLIHSLKNVPHGTVSYEYYPSVDGTSGSLVVYTPPGYTKNTSIKYPVFYLISGTTDTEETWFKVGRTNFILDNLIAEGKAKPMIVVMPYGNIAARLAEQKRTSKPADPTDREGADALNRAKSFETDLVRNVIPYVETNYRAINNRDNRAIGGFSRGGGQTLRTAFGNMDKFSWVCAYSSYLSPQEMEKNYKAIYENPEQTNKQLKLLWVSVGNEDFLYKPTLEFMDFLKAKNLRYKSLITSGGHTWMNTKIYLAATAPLLFQ